MLGRCVIPMHSPVDLPLPTMVKPGWSPRLAVGVADFIPTEDYDDY